MPLQQTHRKQGSGTKERKTGTCSRASATNTQKSGVRDMDMKETLATSRVSATNTEIKGQGQAHRQRVSTTFFLLEKTKTSQIVLALPTRGSNLGTVCGSRPRSPIDRCTNLATAPPRSPQFFHDLSLPGGCLGSPPPLPPPTPPPPRCYRGVRLPACLSWDCSAHRRAATLQRSASETQRAVLHVLYKFRPSADQTQWLFPLSFGA